MKPGITTLTETQYRAAEGVSNSDLTWISPPKTPAHYKARKDGMIEDNETPAKRFGTLVHRAILEPDTIKDSFAVKPDGMTFTTKEGKAWRKDQGEKPIITAEEEVSMRRMVDSVWRHDGAKRLLSGGKMEQALFAEWKGLLLKSRLDALTGGNAIPDVKTCESADPEEFERAILKQGYHRQAAFYLRVCKLLGIDKKTFTWIAVEKTPPYAVAVYAVEEDTLEWGRREVSRDLSLLRHCTEKDDWPAYGGGIGTCGLPEWRLRQLERIPVS